MLTTIPIVALIFLNLIVVYYVFRERERSAYSFYLIVNSFALIAFASGYGFWGKFPENQSVLLIPTFAALLMAANLVLLALEYPKPISANVNSVWTKAVVIFLPLISLIGWDFVASSVARRKEIFLYSSWDIFWKAEGGWPLLLLCALVVITLILLPVQYIQTKESYLRNMPKHLIYVLACPVIFMILFSVFSTTEDGSLIPSPTFAMSFVAQIASLIVVRQMETKRPLYLSRWIYYSIIVVLGFLLSSLIYNLYESVTAVVLLAPQVRMTILVTIVIVVIAGSFPPVQSFFDRLMFSRAYEYRELVLDAQKELNETRERLRQAERLSVVGEMAAQIAHEIKNPLGPIKGYTQMIRSKMQTMPEFELRDDFLRKLDIISEEVNNIDSKVRRLLDVSKRQEIRFKEEDINKMVERAAILLRLEAETLSRGEASSGEIVYVHEELDQSLPEVECNRPRIEEVLMNVCRNAFEARKKRITEITLKTHAMKNLDGIDGIEIVITDNGAGISEKALTHIFEPFYTEKKGGTGLGLSIVRSHIELHGGHAHFMKRKSGGTRVCIWLPLTQVRDNSPPLNNLNAQDSNSSTSVMRYEDLSKTPVPQK